MKKYNSFLGAFFSGDNGDGGYNAAYEKKSLANLYGGGLAPEQEQEALSGLSRVNPEAASKFQNDMVLKSAQLITTLGKDNPLAQQAWQTRIKPQLAKTFGAQAASLPDTIDDNIFAYAQQIAGSGQGAAPSDVQSFEYFTKGMTPEQIRQARENKLGLNKAGEWKTTVDKDTKIPVQSNGLGGLRYFDFDTRQWIDISEPKAGGDVPEENLAFNSLPPEEQEAVALVGNKIGNHYAIRNGKVVPEVNPAGYYGDNEQPSAPQSAGNPLAKTEPTLTPYQQQQIAFQQQAAARAEQAAKDAAAIRADNKAAKDREAQARVADAKQTTDLLLTNVRNLRKHPGFGQLGTFGGNAGDAAIPEFVPTDYRGASARLDTIKGQIAIQAMASLKALSSSGATGFGALSEKELGLLTGSIQTLTTSQNNADIVSALEQIEKYLTKAGQAKTAPQAPQNNDDDALINKWVK